METLIKEDIETMSEHVYNAEMEEKRSCSTESSTSVSVAKPEFVCDSILEGSNVSYPLQSSEGNLAKTSLSL